MLPFIVVKRGLDIMIVEVNLPRATGREITYTMVTRLEERVSVMRDYHQICAEHNLSPSLASDMEALANPVSEDQDGENPI